MRIAIFDSCLRGYNGHHYEYARSIVDECRRRGWATRVYCHRDAGAGLVERLAADPVFHHDIYKLPLRFFERFLGGRLLNLVSAFYGNARYFRELGRVAPEHTDPSDVLFFHTITERQLIAIALWFLFRVPGRNASLVLLLRYRAGMTARSWSFGRITYRLAFALLRLSRRPVRLATDTELLADEYTRLSGRSVAVFPIPHMPGIPAACGAAPARPPTLLMPGHSSIGKGLDVVAAAVERWPDDLAGVRLRVQVSDWISGDSDRVRALLAGMAARPFVTLLQGSPDTSVFYSWLQEADAILVPYNPALYGGQTSGIFAEAVGLGKPVITSPGSWMARQITSGRAAGTVMADYSAGGLIEAVRNFLRNRDHHEQQAAAMAAPWRAFHNSTTFVDLLAGTPHG